MSDFSIAIPYILANECGPMKPDGTFPNGLIDNPIDPGGLTIWGLSTPFLNQIGISGHDSIIAITQDQAEDIYEKYFWNGYGDVNDQCVATKIFDCSVNMGHKEAILLTQRACNSCGQVLTEDGIWGPGTLDGINNCDPNLLLISLVQNLVVFYTQIANRWKQQGKDPTAVNRQLRDWLYRAHLLPKV